MQKPAKVPLKFELGSIGSVAVPLLASLLNDQRARRHLPLATGTMDAAECSAWAKAKQDQWSENGYGPWAITCSGAFVGWGGFQREGEEPDLALVLLPEFWGSGRLITMQMLQIGFADFGFESVTAMLPATRGQSVLCRSGFREDGQVCLSGHLFTKYRLEKAVAMPIFVKEL